MLEVIEGRLSQWHHEHMNPIALERLGIKPFDAAEYLQSDADCAAYLQACIEQAPDDAALFTKALGDVNRSRMRAGLKREHEL